MYRLCLLVACVACAGYGRRLKTTLDQHLSRQDVNGQKHVQQLNSSAGFGSHGQVHRSGSEQFAESVADPRKVVSLLLTSPAIVLGLVSALEPWDKWGHFKLNGEDLPATDVVREWLADFKKSIEVYSSIRPDLSPLAAEADHTHVRAVPPEVPYFSDSVYTVRVVVSVDWEGLYLRKRNLPFFQEFREAHPDVPLTHFMSAAYFTESELQPMQEWSPHRVLHPSDEIGLFVSGLKSLVETAGVQFRSEPNTLQTPEEVFEEGNFLAELAEMNSAYQLDNPEAEWERIRKQNYLSEVLGWDVDIRAYSVDELQAIVAKSKAILKKKGFEVGTSFRVGDRLGGPNVLEAFRREGFKTNSSAVGLDEATWPLSVAEQAFWRDAPLPDMLREIWPGTTKESQPHYIETPAGMILEMPDTGGSAGHSTGFARVEDVVDHINSAVQQLHSEDIFVNIGFHQETAATYGPTILAAITEIKRKHGNRVVFETLRKSARRARLTQRLAEEAAGMRPLGTGNISCKDCGVRPLGTRNNSSSNQNNSSARRPVTWSVRPN